MGSKSKSYKANIFASKLYSFFFSSNNDVKKVRGQGSLQWTKTVVMNEKGVMYYSVIVFGSLFSLIIY